MVDFPNRYALEFFLMHSLGLIVAKKILLSLVLMNIPYTFYKNLFRSVFGVFFCIMIISCGADQGNTAVDSSASGDTIKITNKAGQVFYSIPSPLQMASLLEKSGAKYNPANLNPIENISKYTSSADMALNLGVYATDMSLASIFNQAQETMQYMKQVNTLANNLAIGNAFNENTASRLNANNDKKDSVLLIISEAYWEADAHLKEENRASVSALIIAGGWIEGLYLATKIAGETNNEAVIKRIAEQKLSLVNLLGLLNTYSDDESIKSVSILLEELKQVYDPVSVINDNIVASTDVKLKLTTISSNGTISAITPEQVEEISKKTEYIRNSIIN